MGGNATFKQVLTVAVHTGPIGILSQLFTVPLNYFRGTMTSATTLAVLLPMLPEKSFVSRLLGMIDLFLIWQLVVLSIGLAVLYRRRTQPIATALLVVYAIIAVIVAFVRRGA
jgi:multisubunit Na+/H+ antiporter MnhE subunit